MAKRRRKSTECRLNVGECPEGQITRPLISATLSDVILIGGVGDDPIDPTNFHGVWLRPRWRCERGWRPRGRADVSCMDALHVLGASVAPDSLGTPQSGQSGCVCVALCDSSPLSLIMGQVRYRLPLVHRCVMFRRALLVCAARDHAKRKGWKHAPAALAPP